MIIGNGLLAKAFAACFTNDPTVIVFASGVSNSRETRTDQFERERQLLDSALTSCQRLVYFSTCSVHDPELVQSPYVQHKVAMEKRVLAGAAQNMVFRLPQVVGHCANQHTLTNYLHHQISTGKPFQIWLNAKRNLIDVHDLAAIATDLVASHQADGTISNIACPFSVSVLELVQIFEDLLHKPANYSAVEAGGGYEIETRQAQIIATQLGITFDSTYVRKLIGKYYA
jgi:nucleoside-diphosphate-sugar epimerase